MPDYVIKVNAEKYYTGQKLLPLSCSLFHAKRYSTKNRAQRDAIRIFSQHRYINKVEIVPDQQKIDLGGAYHENNI